VTPARVSVRNVSKVFPRRKATRVRGISTDGWPALRDLFQKTMRRERERHTREKRDQLWALDNVSFDVAPGEIVGIIGRNGAGKSTLLKILARVLSPTAGHITMQGRVVSMLVRRSLLLAGIGVAAGSAIALGLARLASSLLYGITPHDPISYAVAAAVLLVAAVMAGSIPALRAARVDPVTALRSE